MAAERTPHLIRIAPELKRALEKAARREMRSMNHIVERALRDAMTRSGDLRDPAEGGDGDE